MANQVCIVTGATRGIGRATAERFANAGYDLVLSSRRMSDLETLRSDLSDTRCELVEADLAVPGNGRKLVAAAESFGTLRVLINNAGFARLQPLTEMSDEDFDRTMQVNCAAVYETTRTAFPILRRNGGGLIVNISSMASVDPLDGFAVYGASKAWLNVFTQACAAEGKKDNIRVFAVAPGAVETKMLRSVAPDLPAEACLAPADVAAAIYQLTDDAWIYSSGQTIFVRR